MITRTTFQHNLKEFTKLLAISTAAIFLSYAMFFTIFFMGFYAAKKWFCN